MFFGDHALMFLFHHDSPLRQVNHTEQPAHWHSQADCSNFGDSVITQMHIKQMESQRTTRKASTSAWHTAVHNVIWFPHVVYTMCREIDLEWYIPSRCSFLSYVYHWFHRTWPDWTGMVLEGDIKSCTKRMAMATTSKDRKISQGFTRSHQDNFPMLATSCTVSCLCVMLVKSFRPCGKRGASSCIFQRALKRHSIMVDIFAYACIDIFLFIILDFLGIGPIPKISEGVGWKLLIENKHPHSHKVGSSKSHLDLLAKQVHGTWMYIERVVSQMPWDSETDHIQNNTGNFSRMFFDDVLVFSRIHSFLKKSQAVLVYLWDLPFPSLDAPEPWPTGTTAHWWKPEWVDSWRVAGKVTPHQPREHVLQI